MAADGFGHTGGRRVAEILEKRAKEVCREYKREGRERGTSRQDKTSEVWCTESQGRRKEGHSGMLLSVNDKKEECSLGLVKRSLPGLGGSSSIGQVGSEVPDVRGLRII